MNKQLITLAKALESIGFRKEASSIRKLSSLSSEEDKLHDYSWLKYGITGGIKERVGEDAFNEFIKLNRDKFNEWSPKRHLGSGEVGTAWEIEGRWGKRVLKIFDAGASLNDFEKYKAIQDGLWRGEGHSSMPMVYGLGKFKVPAEFYNVKSPSKYNRWSYPQLAWVILEKVTTPQTIAEDYVEHNPHLMNRDDGDHKVDKIPIEAVPMPLLGSYEEDLYDNFLVKFINYMAHRIVIDMIKAYDKAVGLARADKEDPEDPDVLEGIKWSMEKDIEWSEFYGEESLGAFEAVLGLKQGWEEEWAEAVMANLKAGRGDLHGLNLGIRGGKPVFFDG